MDFTHEQKERYSRHFVLENIGEQGQKILMGSKVLIIGAGGLGSPVSYYLAAAGVGTIGIADSDAVDVSNLQRQIIHRTADIGRDKVISAKESMEAVNPDINVIPYKMYVKKDNIRDIIKEYDIVIDAADNFETKFLINDACVLERKPFVHGGVLAMTGQLMTYVPGMGPCYRCVFGDVPDNNTVPTTSQVGIMGVICGVIGSLQATEAVKYLTGKGELLTGYMLTYDAMTMSFRKIKLPPADKENCPVCSNM